MKKSEILKGRRRLYAASGKLEYMFFTSLLISAVALSAALVLFVNGFFKVPSVRSVYTEMFSNSVSSLAPTVIDDKLPDFVNGMASFLYKYIFAVFENAPTAISFFICMLFIVCPIYQGTVRWSAYLTEENRALPIFAVLFYFTSARLYFKSVWMSIRLFLRKAAALFAFTLPATLVFGTAYVLSDRYFEDTTFASAALVLSLVLMLLSLSLYAIYTQKYFAVRYLFALGQTKRLFVASKELAHLKRGWLFTLSLRLSLNLLPAVLVFTAPLSISRIINGHSLAVRALVRQKNTERLKPLR